MRISDWSSDVCSSDLLIFGRRKGHAELSVNLNCIQEAAAMTNISDWVKNEVAPIDRLLHLKLKLQNDALPFVESSDTVLIDPPTEIGRASCRERVCQYV